MSFGNYDQVRGLGGVISGPQLAKLTRPRISHAVTRRRLFEALDAASVPIIWLQGPPGAGKTSLVASYVAAHHLPGVWYQVDRDDGDLASFFYYLSLTQAGEGGALPLLTPEHLSDVESFARKFFRELYARLQAPSIIVFDNLQEVPDASAFHSIIALAAMEAPIGVRIIVLSHGEPSDAYVRLRANGLLALLSWDQLRLSLEETTAIVFQRRPELDRNLVESLHQQADGWVAGLVLLLEQRFDIRLVTNTRQSEWPISIFDYFAREVFNRLESDTRKLLYRTAMLPSLTAEIAEDVSGLADAEWRLEDLYRRQFFVDRRADANPWYQYHSLFRLFLMREAQKQFSESEWNSFLRHAAAALIKHDRPHEAVPLLVEARAWESVVPIILKSAQGLLDQGRWQTLLHWIEALPLPLKSSNPWVRFWLGMCRLRIAPAKAREDLEPAFEEFRHSGNLLGQALAATAIIEAHMVELTDYGQLDPWINELESLLSRSESPFPSPNIELAVRAGFFTAIVHRQTYRTDIPKLARQLADLLRLDFDPNYKLLAARGIFVHCAYSGDAFLTDQVECCTRSAFNAPAASAFNRAWYAVRLGFAQRYAKDARNTAIPWFETARQIVRENGLSFVEAPIAIFWGWAEEVMGEAADIQRELQVLEAHFNPASRLEAAYRQMMIALLLTRHHDFNAAIARMRESLASMTESGHTLGRLAAYMGLVGIHLKCNEFDDALDALEQAVSLWFPCPIRDYAMELLGARISLAKNDVERATAQLRNAITLGEKHGLENCLSEDLFRQATATVCAFALRNDIGTDYVKRIVQVQRLSPPASDVEQWPWPIRIYLFDRFSVLIDGVPLHFVGKAPKKPLELLKALISAGGFGIDAHRLSEQLWPDAEGPRDVFRVTYARLRKLLPYGEAVILDEGKLSLNADLVWTDLGTFERLAAACTNRLADADVQPEEIRALGRSLTRVYQGDLLRGETDAPWLIAARDRAKSKFLRVLKELGRYWESRGDLSSAQELYTRALEIESVAEDIYRRLIRCYARSDQPAEALRTYRRCQQMLSQVLGIAPSAETAALAEHIRSGLPRQPQTTAHAS